MNKPLARTLFSASIFCLLLFVTTSHVVAAGSVKLFLSPSTATKSVGTSFDVEIRANTGTDQVNSVGAFLTYPKDMVDAQISTLNSFANFFSQREIDSATGSIKINGGVSTATSGDNLLVATLTLTPKKTGTVNLTFTNQSVAYKGSTNVLGTTSGAVYTITSASSFGSVSTPVSTPSATPSGAISTPVASSSSAAALPEAGFGELSLFLVLLSGASIAFGLAVKKLFA